MKVKVSDELRSLCRQIVVDSRSEEEWALIESDDMFQGATIEGGYDADEMAFCFSMYTGGREYWFQLTLHEINSIVNGTLDDIEIRPAEKLP